MRKKKDKGSLQRADGRCKSAAELSEPLLSDVKTHTHAGVKGEKSTQVK